MRKLAVAEVMTREVVTAVPDTGFKDIVRTMVANDVDALPVLDRFGRPLGVVTEADVLAKAEFHGGVDSLPVLGGTRRLTRWHKARGLTAAALMSRPALTVAENCSLDRALRTMADHGAARVYVVERTGVLTGALTRRAALNLFLRVDSAILADVEREVRSTAEDARQLVVDVADGVVTLTGWLSLRSMARRIIVVAGQVPGVVAVRNNLGFDIDDFTVTGF